MVHEDVTSSEVVEVRDPAGAEAYADMAMAYGARRVDAVLRTLDVAIAGTVLVLLSPILLLVALVIRISSGSPVLYRGERVGTGGRDFTMFKLRTLRPDAEARLGDTYGAELTELTRREVTRLGRILRATHLDEVPQLWNVIRGDMSIVGPRPIRRSFLVEVSREVPQYWQRLVVRPGVTGFAQTRITREEAWAYKLAHDLEYIADRSVSLYLRVLGATIWRIASRSVRGLADHLRGSSQAANTP